MFLIAIPFILGLFGRFNWFLDVFSHFRVYYCIAFLVIGIGTVLLKRWKEAGVSLGMSLILFLTFADLYAPGKKTKSSEGLRITSINLLAQNDQYEKTISFIEEEALDVIFFQELTYQWALELDELTKEYPYHYMLPRNGSFGIGVFSKYEFKNLEIIDFVTSSFPSLVMELETESGSISVINTHPPPPMGTELHRIRNIQFDRINEFISQSDKEIVLIGDLNSTRFSPNFKRLTKNRKLRDSRKGFGILPTWHAQFPLLSVTLDHAFITKGITVLDRRVGPDIGSDHLPVIIEIEWD